MSFITSYPRRINYANLLTVEKLSSSNTWNVVYTDADWETKFILKRLFGFIPWFHIGEIQWTIESPFRGCLPGTYRIRHFGVAKDVFQRHHQFIGETSSFQVIC